MHGSVNGSVGGRMEANCFICGKVCKAEGCGTGYGVDSHGHKICYDCAGKLDERNLRKMKIGEKTIHYLKRTVIKKFENAGESCEYEVVNWPGTFRHHLTLLRRGRHNIAGEQVHFRLSLSGDTPLRFHCVHYGFSNTQLHVRRIKG